MAAPPIAERHRPWFHRKAPMLESVRAATTANIVIATALNNGDVLDGVTLATDDRVLVKDQTAGAENGIYTVAAVPVREYDVSTSDPGWGYLVNVRQGTVNASTLWRNTNTAAPTIGTTALTFAAVYTVASFATPAIVLGTAAAAGAATTVIRSDSTVVAFDATVPTTSAIGDAAATGSVALAARRDHRHGREALSTATPLAESGSGSVGTAVKASREDHVHPIGPSDFVPVYQNLFSGDAVATAFELPAAPFDAYSVQAFVAGVLTDVTLSGTLLTTATFAAAPAAGTNNIRFDIVAAVV